MCAKNTNLFVKKKMTAEIQFVSYAASSGQKRQLLRRKLCTNINQPYLIWAAVLCHVPQPREPMILGPMPQSGWKKKNVDVLSMMMTCNGRYSQDEVRPANYIKFTYYQLSQLKLNNATRERIMQLLRWTVFRIVQTNFKKNWKETVKYRPSGISTLV